MKIDTVALMYLALVGLVGLLFCMAVKIVFDWATRRFGKKIDPLRMELNDLNFKIDAFENKLDDLTTVVNALTAKLASLEKLIEQHGMSEHARNEFVQDESIPTAPTTPADSADSWSRDTGPYAAFRRTR